MQRKILESGSYTSNKGMCNPGRLERVRPYKTRDGDFVDAPNGRNDGPPRGIAVT